MCEYVLLMFWMFGMIKFYKYNLLVFDDEVILEYFVENIFVVGLVQIVVDKFEVIYDQVGGFGYLLIFGFDYSDNLGLWKELLWLLVYEVMFRFNVCFVIKFVIVVVQLWWFVRLLLVIWMVCIR